MEQMTHIFQRNSIFHLLNISLTISFGALFKLLLIFWSKTNIFSLGLLEANKSNFLQTEKTQTAPWGQNMNLQSLLNNFRFSSLDFRVYRKNCIMFEKKYGGIFFKLHHDKQLLWHFTSRLHMWPPVHAIDPRKSCQETAGDFMANPHSTPMV